MFRIMLSFDAAVDEHDLLLRDAVGLGLLHGDPSSQSRQSRTSRPSPGASCSSLLLATSSPLARMPHHHAPLPDRRDQRARVDALDPGDALVRHPPRKRLPDAQWLGLWQFSWTTIPRDLDPTRLEVPGEPEDVLLLHARDPVVPDERVREAEDLASVGGVGHRLGIADHPRVEDDLADDRRLGTETLPEEERPVLEKQDRGVAPLQVFPSRLLKKKNSGLCPFLNSLTKFRASSRIHGRLPDSRSPARLDPLPLLRYEVGERGEGLPDLLHLHDDDRVGVAAHRVLDVDVPPRYLVVEVDEAPGVS